MAAKPIGFEWDDHKAEANLQKHGVSFLEASTVFEDDNALYMADAAHSDDEARFLILGMSIRSRILIVAHCYHGDDGVIRIISARRAPPAQEAMYQRRRR